MKLPAARRFRSAIVACAAALALAITVPHPASAQEGAAAVQDVTLTDVQLPLGATLVKVPKLTASGTRLSKDDLAAIFRADSPEPWQTRLARLDAASLTAPVFLAEQAGPGNLRQSTTYRDIVARDVRAGKIGELTIAGATISSKGDKPAQNGAGTYGAIRASGLDLTALARLAIEPGDGKGPLQTVYGALRVADMAFSSEQGITFKFARFEVTDLGGRQVANGWSKAVDTMAAGYDAAADKRRALLTTADLIEAQSIGRMEIGGVSVSDTSLDTPMLMEIDRLSFAATGPDAGVVVEGLGVASGATRTRLGKLNLAGASLGPFVTELRRIAETPDVPPGPEESRRLAVALGTLTLSDLTVDLPPEPPVQKRGAVDTPRQKQAQNSGTPARARVAEARPPDAKAGDPLVAIPVKSNRIALQPPTVLRPRPGSPSPALRCRHPSLPACRWWGSFRPMAMAT